MFRKLSFANITNSSNHDNVNNREKIKTLKTNLFTSKSLGSTTDNDLDDVAVISSAAPNDVTYGSKGLINAINGPKIVPGIITSTNISCMVPGTNLIIQKSNEFCPAKLNKPQISSSTLPAMLHGQKKNYHHQEYVENSDENKLHTNTSSNKIHRYHLNHESSDEDLEDEKILFESNDSENELNEIYEKCDHCSTSEHEDNDEVYGKETYLQENKKKFKKLALKKRQQLKYNIDNQEINKQEDKYSNLYLPVSYESQAINKEKYSSLDKNIKFSKELKKLPKDRIKHVKKIDPSFTHYSQEKISENNHEKSGCKLTFIFDPSGRLCYYRSMIVSLAFLYNFWIIIYRFAFDEISSPTMTIWLTLDLSADFTYLIDIAINFRTGYLEEGVLQTDVTKLRQHYLNSTMFYIDCLCLLPLDILYLSMGFNSFLRCFRLVKIYRFWSFLDRTERHTNYPNLFRTLTLAHYILVIFHWNACVYHLISKREVFGSTNWFSGSRYEDCSDVQCDYLHAFYWSTLALTITGDLPTPRTKSEYIFLIFELFCGLLLFATVLGHVAIIVTNVSAARKEFQAKMDSAKTYMRMRRVPEHLKIKVIKWFDHLWMTQKSSDEDKSVGFLPAKLKAEIAIHVHLDTLKRVEIFQNTESGFLCALVLRLKPILFSPGDYVCRKGEVGKEMYIVSKGKLQVVTDGGKTVLATLRAGSYFGEISILNMGTAGNRRTASVRSVGYSDLFCLNKQDMWAVLKDYPAARVRLEAIASKRLEKYKKRPMSSKYGYNRPSENCFNSRDPSTKNLKKRLLNKELHNCSSHPTENPRETCSKGVNSENSFLKNHLSNLHHYSNTLPRNLNTPTSTSNSNTINNLNHYNFKNDLTCYQNVAYLKNNSNLNIYNSKKNCTTNLMNKQDNSLSSTNQIQSSIAPLISVPSQTYQHYIGLKSSSIPTNLECNNSNTSVNFKSNELGYQTLNSISNYENNLKNLSDYMQCQLSPKKSPLYFVNPNTDIALCLNKNSFYKMSNLSNLNESNTKNQTNSNVYEELLRLQERLNSIEKENTNLKNELNNIRKERTIDDNKINSLSTCVLMPETENQINEKNLLISSNNQPENSNETNSNFDVTQSPSNVKTNSTDLINTNEQNKESSI